MYRVYCLRLSLNLRMQPAAGKNFHLQLTNEKMRAFETFTEKYLRRYDCNGNDFTATLNCVNPKTEIRSEIIETKIKWSL